MRKGKKEEKQEEKGGGGGGGLPGPLALEEQYFLVLSLCG